ncbi:MAG: TIR domain-containing protein [Leptolyngbyaceae cyanobacterium SM2_5_2]|nr:TIR domain-containing protein [Leptolyngbyaceae cyanobacterium SM2_5_2]
MLEESVKLFISYSHLNEKERQELVAHLSGLINEKLVTLWHDRKIEAGMDWAKEIDTHLNTADITLLLVSPYFMASNYCTGIELKRAMERHEAGEAYVVPIILMPVDWNSAPFSKLQAFPKEAKPIYSSYWAYPHEAFLDVVQGIRVAAEGLLEKRRQKIAQKQADQARYLQKVKETLSDGVISEIERETLVELQEELGLTPEEVDEIERQAYEPFRKKEEDRNRYRKTLINLIEKGLYPFSPEIEKDLEWRRRDLGLEEDDITCVEGPILAEAKAKYDEKLQAEAAERQRQLDLEAETQLQLERQQQKQEVYEVKRHRYEEEFIKAVRGLYPLSEETLEGLRAFQQSLDLSAEDVDAIEQPILAEAKATCQQKLQAEAAERQQQLELEAEAQQQEEQKQVSMARYRQKVEEVLRDGYISTIERDTLDELREDLGLTVEEAQAIEHQIYEPLKAFQGESADSQGQLHSQQSQQPQQQLAAIETQEPKTVKFKSYVELKGHSGMFAGVNAVAISPDGQTIASGSDDHTIKVWDLTTRQELRTLSGHTGFVKSVAFSPKGDMLATGSGDKTIKLWDWKTGRELYTLAGHSDGITTVAFSPTGNLLGDIVASGSDDHTIKLWRCETGEEVFTFLGHSSYVQALEFSPDGQTLASGSWDNTLKLWDCNTYEEIFSSIAHTNGVKAVAISPDGQTLVSSGRDGTCKLWNLPTGELRQTISVQGESFMGDGVVSVAISPDSKTIATASDENKIVKLWSIETGNLTQTLSGYSKGVTSVVFSPDGHSLVTGSKDKIVTIWL